ncbi:addiction module protein [Aquabacterium sp. A7-Y]|uniref:addiction module protein n=1 Tax=Aquabacterium sp. A7-Y TaxID=1349605 RepID=UPI00223C90EA|nr:addiction module protein [Aquabacterium sp. A7-Y]MCW7540891.1 addiction module protein [Aquabacterium sp. A7-Y]
MLTLDQIRTEARTLSEEERAALVLDLLESLDPAEPSEDVERQWNEEALRRLDEYDRGLTEAIPSEQVHAEAVALLQKYK